MSHILPLLFSIDLTICIFMLLFNESVFSRYKEFCLLLKVVKILLLLYIVLILLFYISNI